MSIILSIEQEQAVDQCSDMDIKIACVTGGAGVGKTTIMKQVYENLYDQLRQNVGKDAWDGVDTSERNAIPNFSIQLAAPTGRAAKRIEEATGISAMTIHRMLRYSVPEDDEDFGLPKHTKQNPMHYDVILIDEASMVTKELRRNILDAMKKGSIIRFFGDVNQLPPIDINAKDGILFSPFNTDLKKFPSTILTKNYRSEDGIISVAQAIINNKMPISNDQVQMYRVPISQGLAKIRELVENVDFTLDGNQIICPTKVNKNGTIAINNMMQVRFNPNKEKINVYRSVDGQIQTKSFKVNDKILWTKNDYDLDLMNGTLGRILAFDEETGTIRINADGRDIDIPSQAKMRLPSGDMITYDPRHRLELGYAISTHASQGSQFDYVCYVVARSRAATRQNVYTAITRAKERLTIINIGGALSHAIANVTKLSYKDEKRGFRK